jgi:hypothetical protein
MQHEIEQAASDGGGNSKVQAISHRPSPMNTPFLCSRAIFDRGGHQHQGKPQM